MNPASRTFSERSRWSFHHPSETAQTTTRSNSVVTRNRKKRRMACPRNEVCWRNDRRPSCARKDYRGKREPAHTPRRFLGRDGYSRKQPGRLLVRRPAGRAKPRERVGLVCQEWVSCSIGP